MINFSAVWSLSVIFCIQCVKYCFQLFNRINVTLDNIMASQADRVLIATSPSDALPTWERLSCGFIAGAVARTVTSPLDVVKLLLQVNTKGGSMKDTITELWQKDGIKAFWRGNMVAVMNQGPQSAIKFFCVDELTRQVHNFTKKPITTAQRALIGGAAGIISQFISFPFDLIHTRITINPQAYKGIFQATGKIIKEEGFTALWSGIVPTVTGAVVYEGSQYVISGGLKEKFIQLYGKNGKITPWQNLFIGAASGAIGQTISFPFDVVRKRMMIRDENGNKLYKSMGECFSKTYKNEGLGGFFRGIGINMVKIVPYSALQFTINEEAKGAFIKFNQYMDARKAPAAAPKKGRK